MKYLAAIGILVCMAGAVAGAPEGKTGATDSSGKFVTVKPADGNQFRMFAAGPENAPAGILVVHDYLGISEATRQSVEHLAALGYRAAAVDLYGGKSATTHEDAVKLMQGLDTKAAEKVLQAALDSLKKSGRKVATIGYSMGAQHSLIANLNDPEAVSASVMIYGGGFDQIDTKRLQKLNSPVLVVTGSEDQDATQAAIRFLANMREAKRQNELFIYPGADHGYAQPLFNGGKNYNPEAVRTTWVVVEDFLNSHLLK